MQRSRIGTEDLKSDSNLKGAALGMGSTGIPGKVEKGLDALYQNIININCPDKQIALITIDTSGFSRGAAAARNAIHVVLEDKKLRLDQRLQKAGYTVQKIEIKFVGLFDTVSHYGLYMNNDVKDLTLDAIKKAEKVIQLAAADEYRHNFPLIDVSSNGTQISLPGVHSDVGGSYLPVMQELNMDILEISGTYKEVRDRFMKEIQWIVDEGWFKNVKAEIDDSGSHVVLNRYNILNTYTFIPMLIMKNHANQSKLNFNEIVLETYTDQVDASPDLKQLRALLGQLGNESWRNAKDLMRSVRHKYCHFNALYSFVGVNNPEWSTGNPMTGIRKRVVYNG